MVISTQSNYKFTRIVLSTFTLLQTYFPLIFYSQVLIQNAEWRANQREALAAFLNVITKSR